MSDAILERTDLATRYLRIMKDALMGTLCRMVTTTPEEVVDGRFFVEHGAVTMIGRHRLDNIEACVRSVVEDGVPGDLLEAGVWRGGACVFMRALLEALDDQEKAHVAPRRVHVADSFQGLPPPVHAADAAYAALPGVNVKVLPILKVTADEVRANFARYGFDEDPRVVFHEGWFKDTLPTADTGPLAVLRLDGDFYESTMDTLRALEPRVSPGGYVIVDDYGAVPPMCGAAVDDYRREKGITEELVKIDWTGVYWRKACA